MSCLKSTTLTEMQKYPKSVFTFMIDDFSSLHLEQGPLRVRICRFCELCRHGEKY